MADASNLGKPPRRRFRKCVFALLLNLVLLGLAEALAWIFSPPYYVPVAREAGLARAKAPGEKRVFLYGESTIYGWPYGPRNSTACWLDQILKAVLPGENVRTINFGRPGRGTPHLRDALEHTLAYQPDVVVLCIGHNEFLPWTHQFVEGPLHGWTYFHSHLYRTAHEAHLRLRRKRDAANYAGLPPGTPVHDRILTSYHQQMEAMLTAARDRGVRALLCVPGCNLAEQPPQISD